MAMKMTHGALSGAGGSTVGDGAMVVSPFATGRGTGEESDGTVNIPLSAAASLSGTPPMIRERIHAVFQDAKLSIRQESELQPKFGAWLRANSRGTDATLTVRSSSESLLKQLKDGLENGTSSSSVTR